jgi:hypothetical protein
VHYLAGVILNDYVLKYPETGVLCKLVLDIAGMPFMTAASEIYYTYNVDPISVFR